jgi:endonuclease YncB( thermonuclease family)
MAIRVYGVDCPEIGEFGYLLFEAVISFFPSSWLSVFNKAKFGNPSMPYGDAAKEFTEQLINNKVVRIKLLRKDQYNRAVAKVTTPGFLPFTKKDVTLQLAERGLATLYTGGGAEYDVSCPTYPLVIHLLHVTLQKN